ncbi:MAG: hypothetical protein WDO68_29920 [Gammaproteobacteria bacterium]
MKRVAPLLGTSVVSLSAFAGGIASNLPVRIEGAGIESGWFEGRTDVTREGCTVVKLSKATKDGYILLSLVAVNRLQRKEGAGWRDLSVADLRAREPKQCLVDGAD